jgi:hypothetical protein
LDSNWGGSRDGSGRKKLPDDTIKKGYTFQLTQDELDFIEKFEGENRSQKLRNMIREYENLKKQIDKSSC